MAYSLNPQFMHKENSSRLLERKFTLKKKKTKKKKKKKPLLELPTSPHMAQACYYKDLDGEWRS